MPELPEICAKKAKTNDEETVDVVALDWYKYLEGCPSPWHHRQEFEKK
jgi:hypothetical protein